LFDVNRTNKKKKKKKVELKAAEPSADANWGLCERQCQALTGSAIGKPFLSKGCKGRYNTQHNDIQHNDLIFGTKHNDTQHNGYQVPLC
jgi:hypothetical protein